MQNAGKKKNLSLNRKKNPRIRLRSKPATLKKVIQIEYIG